MAKRRLEDLWVVGKFVTFDDGKGDPVTVWLQKLSPIDAGGAMRRANAARARVRALKYDRDSEDFMDLWAEVLEWDGKDQLVTYLLAEHQLRIEQRVEAQLAGEGEWAEENYLSGLRDAWEGGLSDTYIAEPESPDGVEAARVLAELQRFAAQAAERGTPEVAIARAELEAQDLKSLQEMAVERVISYRATTSWMEEFHRCELFYGVHPAQPDAHRPDKWVAMPGRYFAKREEVDRLPAQVLQRLHEEYALLGVDPAEGKDLEETPSSSASSESPFAPAMEVSSGPVAVAP